MIFDSTDLFGDSAQAAERAPEVFMKLLTPLRTQQRTTFLGAEDDMIMKAIEG